MKQRKVKNNKRVSRIWGVNVRPEIAKEFTYNNKIFDENLAGLHEIRARLAEKLTADNKPQAIFPMA